MPQFLQLLCKVRVELGGEIHNLGCRRLGDGQPHALLPADQIGISRAVRCPEITGGRQFDGLFAGRTAHGRDGEPVGRGFGIVVHDRKRPVGRGGKRDRCGPLLDGVKRIFGLLDDQLQSIGSCLGDGQPHLLLPADDIHKGRAGGGVRIAGGRQFDGLFAGRTARGRDSQPVGRGFGIVVHDRKRPVGRGGERNRCGPIFDGVKRIFGLLDGQVFGTGVTIVLLAACKGKGGSECQQIKTFHRLIRLSL